MRKLLLPILALLLAATSLHGQSTPTAQGYLKSSMAHYQSGDMDAALADVNKAIELNPGMADAFALRAAIRGKKGDTEGVLTDYNKIIELAPTAPSVAVIYHNRSMIRLQKGDVDGALDDLNKAISINSDVAELYNARAIARLQQGDLNGSLSDYEKVIALKPTLPSAFVGRGYFRMQKGDFGEAVADFNKAIELKSDYADAYAYRGLAHGLNGEMEGAIADIKKGSILNPQSVSDMSRGNFTSPFKGLNEFIKSNPSNARAFEMRGVFRLFQGNHKEAERDFQKSLELDSNLKSEIDKITKASK